MEKNPFPLPLHKFVSLSLFIAAAIEPLRPLIVERIYHEQEFSGLTLHKPASDGMLLGNLQKFIENCLFHFHQGGCFFCWMRPKWWKCNHFPNDDQCRRYQLYQRNPICKILQLSKNLHFSTTTTTTIRLMWKSEPETTSKLHSEISKVSGIRTRCCSVTKIIHFVSKVESKGTAYVTTSLTFLTDSTLWKKFSPIKVVSPNSSMQ